MDESSECLPVIERSIDLPADAERVWEMIIDGDLAAECTAFDDLIDHVITDGEDGLSDE